jgi:zinc transport system substrate-binding protein
MIALAVFLLSLNSLAFGSPAEPSEKIRIVATFFPIYLFVENITSGISDLEVELLLPAAYGCPHDFSLAPEDVKRVHQADIIVQDGLGMEPFLPDLLKTGRHDKKIITASDGIEPIVAKFSEKDEHLQDTGAFQYNPHPFASPREAARMVDKITASLAEMLPALAGKIKENGYNYRARLEKLSQEFADSLKDLRNNRVVTVHEVFEYMGRDYGFKIVDIIEKEAGQEPSAREMMGLVQRIQSEKVAALFTEPQYSSKMADVLGRETNRPVFMLDPIASGPPDPPLDYYEKTMFENLKTLMEALK